MAAQAQIDALLRRMREMSAADISVLEASAQTPGSNMTTSPGSPNEILWSEMVGLGWMESRDEMLELPEGARFLIRIYSISPEGLEPIRNLLSALVKSWR